ncbi:hypothetical protein V1511DRAFT_506449 [Dipodascopsis uninucleata]
MYAHGSLLKSASTSSSGQQSPQQSQQHQHQQQQKQQQQQQQQQHQNQQQQQSQRHQRHLIQHQPQQQISQQLQEKQLQQRLAQANTPSQSLHSRQQQLFSQIHKPLAGANASSLTSSGPSFGTDLRTGRITQLQLQPSGVGGHAYGLRLQHQHDGFTSTGNSRTVATTGLNLGSTSSLASVQSQVSQLSMHSQQQRQVQNAIGRENPGSNQRQQLASPFLSVHGQGCNSNSSTNSNQASGPGNTSISGSQNGNKNNSNSSAGTPGTPGMATTGNSAGSSPAVGKVTSSFHGRDDFGLKAYVMTPPVGVAPLLKDNTEAGYPDFYPWIGTHPEDLLTENYIQHGYENKPFLSNETGSARQTLYATLRQKSSLAALSNFMMTSLDERHELNRIRGPSTFKPPPRVTLTDHKRESWLQDLASAAVPLRRLSRTIPHGIRNKVLIEQCCNKSVPMHRAVWFARCVGANELRGLKRKGTHTSVAEAEVQWIREWSVQLTNVIEKIASECGIEPNWRQKMDYIIRFASHLYYEDLIDRNYFLDWTISALEKSSKERIPLLIVIVRTIWLEMVKVTGKVRRLSEVLLEHIKSVGQEEEENQNSIERTLMDKLCDCAWELTEISNDAFVIPERWLSNRSILQKALLRTGKPGAEKLFEKIALKNICLSQSLTADATGNSVTSEEEHREELIRVLRNASTPYDTEQISDEFMLTISVGNNPTSDMSRAVGVLFEWAVCGFHGQMERIDLATSVLAKWSSSKAKEVFEAVFCLFDGKTNSSDVDAEMLKVFLRLLVEKGVVVVDQYIRRVISRGILLSNHPEKMQGHAFVLMHLPFRGYPKYIQNQRDILLTNIDKQTKLKNEGDVNIEM